MRVCEILKTIGLWKFKMKPIQCVVEAVDAGSGPADTRYGYHFGTWAASPVHWSRPGPALLCAGAATLIHSVRLSVCTCARGEPGPAFLSALISVSY